MFRNLRQLSYFNKVRASEAVKTAAESEARARAARAAEASAASAVKAVADACESLSGRLNNDRGHRKVISKMRTENEELRAAVAAAEAAKDVLKADQAEERATLFAEREAAVEKNRRVLLSQTDCDCPFHFPGESHPWGANPAKIWLHEKW